MSAPLTIGAIRHRVAVAYGVDPRLLLSARRARAIVRPRQLAMWLAARLLPASLPQIGRAFGGRDHTTVMYSLAKIDAMRAADADFCAFVNSLEAALGASVAA